MKTYLLWAWWHVYYFVRSLVYDDYIRLDDYARKSWRLRRPWWKFKPCAVYFQFGDYWQVYFEDVVHYEADETIKLVVERAEDDDRIVGFKIYGERLRPPEKEEPTT